ncbi:IclR family transcriptional regulator [Jatrophihabitans telluris]|uniref:IclR family transcriptional regulator n=1 Tax=Jatrophihabitans telluris TaxID=2038343 RepID=A0ABY4QUA8_9ACTN|nr:IclR family transcriptional regulator [Jatrophihabitans telluris]UQX86878.1 IclR family transcriptional regulator [Jatrophihabitans telluris]
MLALLGAFDADHRELTLTELARRAGLTLSTAQRRASELAAWGALERTDAGRYRVGLRLWEVGSLAPRGLGLREVALPFLEDLYVVSRENVQLAVREGTEAVFVERIAGRSAVRVLTRVGGRFALHATGVGLVLLAHAPPEVFDQVVRAGLASYTPATITDPAALRGTLAGVRRDGYAVSRGAVTEDALSVAAPITDAGGHVVAAVSLVVAIDGARPQALAPLVRAAARGISRAYATYGDR